MKNISKTGRLNRLVIPLSKNNEIISTVSNFSFPALQSFAMLNKSVFKTNKDFYFTELHNYLHIYSLVVPRTIVLHWLLLSNLLMDIPDVRRHVVVCGELRLADWALVVLLALKNINC